MVDGVEAGGELAGGLVVVGGDGLAGGDGDGDAFFGEAEEGALFGEEGGVGADVDGEDGGVGLGGEDADAAFEGVYWGVFGACACAFGEEEELVALLEGAGGGFDHFCWWVVGDEAGEGGSACEEGVAQDGGFHDAGEVGEAGEDEDGVGIIYFHHGDYESFKDWKRAQGEDLDKIKGPRRKFAR